MIETKDWGTSSIGIKNNIGHSPAKEMRPAEIHHKKDGTIGDLPSFCIVMVGKKGEKVFGQVSFKMLSRAMGSLGYELIKSKSK